MKSSKKRGSDAACRGIAFFFGNRFIIEGVIILPVRRRPAIECRRAISRKSWSPFRWFLGFPSGNGRVLLCAYGTDGAARACIFRKPSWARAIRAVPRRTRKRPAADGANPRPGIKQFALGIATRTSARDRPGACLLSWPPSSDAGPRLYGREVPRRRHGGRAAHAPAHT